MLRLSKKKQRQKYRAREVVIFCARKKKQKLIKLSCKFIRKRKTEINKEIKVYSPSFFSQEFMRKNLGKIESVYIITH